MDNKYFQIKPIWSNQIPTGSYKVLLGKWNNFIRLYSSIYYFISDGLCVPEGKLENKKKQRNIINNKIKTI